MESKVYAIIDTVNIADIANGFRAIFRQKISHLAYVYPSNPDAIPISYTNGNKYSVAFVNELTSEAVGRYPSESSETVDDLNDIADKVLGEYLTILKNMTRGDDGSGNGTKLVDFKIIKEEDPDSMRLK